ncbi:MAG: CHAD domain-containing protein, partial [Bacteroidota bacterium]
MNILIDNTTQAQLHSFVNDPLTDDERKRHARIILAYALGEDTRSIAAEAGLSESRTRYWRGVFEKYGMEMFSAGFTPTVIRRHTATGEKQHTLELSVEQKQILHDRLSEEKDEDLRRRMTIILAYCEGRDTASIAAETGLSASRTRYWRKMFEREGMTLFDSRRLSTSGNVEGKGSRKSGPGITVDDPFAEAGRKVLRRYFTDMLQQETHPDMDNDPEVVHRMRVATRRLRSAFEIFDDAFEEKTKSKFRKPLRLLARALGCVRDLDVLLEHMREYANALPPEDTASFAPLLDAWEEERMLHYTALRAHLASESYH